jgi:hypothetical protein
MAGFTVGIENYVNEWAIHDMKLDEYIEYSNEGNLQVMERALKTIKSPVQTVEEYRSAGVTFEPDFTSKQEHRMNVLCALYNAMISEGTVLQVDRLKDLTQRAIYIIKDWSTDNPIL